MNPITFFVFSYNRGECLANCVESIEACAPESPLTVIDDDSSDPGTLRVLEQLSRRVRVIGSAVDSGHKHGGLYENMQGALERAHEESVVCFLQDDTQLVRRLDDHDHAFVAACFNRDPALGFLSPCFLRRGSLTRRGGVSFEYDEDTGLFYRHAPGHSAGDYYSDISIARVDRLLSLGWVFQPGEPANQRQAALHFRRMGYLRRPFAMWLPNGSAYRGRTKSLALRLAERRRRCGVYPIRYMTASEVTALSAREAAMPPVAEDWLDTVASVPPPLPWTYNPLQESRILKHLDRLEGRVRRLWRG